MAATVDQYKLDQIRRTVTTDMKKRDIKSVFGIGCPPCEDFARMKYIAYMTLRDSCTLTQAQADCITSNLYKHCG